MKYFVIPSEIYIHAAVVPQLWGHIANPAKENLVLVLTVHRYYSEPQ